MSQEETETGIGIFPKYTLNEIIESFTKEQSEANS
jgi:hypothetical protein